MMKPKKMSPDSVRLKSQFFWKKNSAHSNGISEPNTNLIESMIKIGDNDNLKGVDL